MVLFTQYIPPKVSNSDRNANKLHFCLRLNMLNSIDTKLMHWVTPKNASTLAFISSVRAYRPRQPVMKTKLFECAPQTRGIWKRRLSVAVCGEHILKTKLIDDDGLTIVRWFPWSCFPQNYFVLQFSRCSESGKYLLGQSEWNLRFEIPPATEALNCNVGVRWSQFQILKTKS